MNRWGERGEIQLLARQAPHSRAALAAPRTTQRNRFFVAARETAHLRRAALAFRLARSHRVRGRAVGAPGVGGGVPVGGPGYCAAAAARPLTQKGRRLAGGWRLTGEYARKEGGGLCAW
jgi:hypothetical protein